jgi:hypothetical protein
LPWMDMQQESINLTHTELGMCWITETNFLLLLLY